MNEKKFAEEFGRIDSAFVDEALDYRRKRSIFMSKKKLVAVIAAAVVTVLLSVSVAAATYTFEVDEHDATNAFSSALSYAIANADTPEQHDVIAYYANNGLYDKSVTGQMLGLRTVFNVKFKVGGYAYDIDVDTKTLVVLRCKKKIDHDWDEHFDAEGYAAVRHKLDIALGLEDPGVTVGNVFDFMAVDLVGDYFGLHCCDVPNSGGEIKYEMNYDTDPMSYDMQLIHGGYIYECSVDSVTGEIFNINIREVTDEDMEASHVHSEVSVGGVVQEIDPNENVHLHEHRDDFEYIGGYEAKTIAIEALGLSDFDGEFRNFWCTPLHISHGQIVASGVEFIPPDYVDSYYIYHVQPYDDGDAVEVFLDARTGEILKIADTEGFRSYGPPHEVPSANATEGMLSEAEAQIIVLEEMGLSDRRDLQGFSIELNGDVYEVFVIRVHDETEYNFTVDAMTGEILARSSVNESNPD